MDAIPILLSESQLLQLSEMDDVVEECFEKGRPAMVLADVHLKSGTAWVKIVSHEDAIKLVGFMRNELGWE